MTKAIDVSNYSAIPTDAQCRCMMDAGYTVAIVGTSFGNVWQQQIAAFERNGFDVEEYVFPGQPSGKTNHPYWIDCETPSATMMAIRASAQTAKGIYTRRGWWVDNTGDWNIKSEFPWLKLWDAAYGDPPPAFVPYGGFTERAMHQWHDSTDLCGLNVDLNIIEEEPDMEFTAQNKQDIADIVRIEVLKALGTLPDGNGDQYKRNMVDLAHAGSQQTVDGMVKAGQVKPPQS